MNCSDAVRILLEAHVEGLDAGCVTQQMEVGTEAVHRAAAACPRQRVAAADEEVALVVNRQRRRVDGGYEFHHVLNRCRRRAVHDGYVVERRVHHSGLNLHQIGLPSHDARGIVKFQRQRLRTFVVFRTGQFLNRPSARLGNAERHRERVPAARLQRARQGDVAN